LPANQWQRVEDSVDRALAWLAKDQQPDGSFRSTAPAQPAATSLAVMAFLSRGHQPGFGPYGEQLNRAIDFVLSCQMPDGLFSYQEPQPQYVQRGASHTATYNHGISGLMLGEVYGQISGERAARVRQAIEKALLFTRANQLRSGVDPEAQGGWRYLRSQGKPDSDLSVTAWQIMFLRSARNSEFQVPQAYVNDAMDFVRRCWDAPSGGFCYATSYDVPARGMSGAGIVCLSMAGEHQTPMARAAGDWLLAHPFQRYGDAPAHFEKFIYSVFYCSQAAAQLGGKYWELLYPPMVSLLLNNQKPNGAWPADPQLTQFGEGLTTAFAVLSLTPPYQILPIYQR